MPDASREPSSDESSKLDDRLSDVTTGAELDENGMPIGPTHDEQPVNDALLLFLSTLILYNKELKCDWPSARSPFPRVAYSDITVKSLQINILFASNRRSK